MNSHRFAFPALAVSFALVLAPLAAVADAYNPPASDVQAGNLWKLGRDLKSSKAVPGASFKVAHAEIFVKAPLSYTRTAVADFGNYSSFISKFQKSKILKRDGGATEVYLQIPILKGAATIWGVERFEAPVKDGIWERVRGKFVKGNVEDMYATWSYRAVDEKNSVVMIDLYVAPKIAVPAMLVTPEVEDAAGEGVLGIRAQAEMLSRKVALKP